MRCGASKNTSVRASAASSAMRARRSPSRAGRNPSKVNRSVGRPAMLSAAVMAEGPGTATTLMPSCATRRTSSNPGSDKQRRPRVAHQRNARAGAQLFQQLVDALALVVFVQRHQRARQPERCQQLPRPARVFRRDQFRGRKFIARAWRKIAKIADGRRDHRKTPQVRCHYNSPPRQDAQALVKAIRRMTPKKALVRPFALLGRRRRWRWCSAVARPRPAVADHPTSIAPKNSPAPATMPRAAAVYERLAAETTGSDSAEFRLRAARAWLAAGRAADADRVLALLPGRAHAATGARAETAAHPVRAGCRVAAMKPGARSAPCRRPAAQPAAARYYETRQQVAIATGHLIDGIRSEFSRERVIGPGDARTARAELLAQLRAAAERGVSLAPPPGSDATVRGWLEAASVALDNSRNPTLGATRLAAFRARYPSHPALAALSGEPGIGIDEPVARLDSAPHVALMLPLSGRTSAPAAQIRDGFMTAYYQLPAATRPRLRVYDTAITSIADTMAQATATGAEFIVGPLTREEVVAAGDLLTTRPPILALNFLPADRPTPERFFQFALSPEDDARAVARYISASGRRRGVVLTPEGDWGTRVAAAFDEELRAAGGYVLGQASFGATTRNDFSRQHHAGVAHRRQPHASPAHPGHHRPEARARTAPAPRHPVHLRAQPAWRGAPAAAATALPSRRRHSHLHAGRCLRAASHRQPGNRRRDVPGHAVDAGRRRFVRPTVREAARQAFGDSERRRGRLFAFGYDAFRIADVAADAAPTSIPRASPARCPSTRRDASDANSSGCASRTACRYRSNAPDTTAATTA